MKKKEKLMMSEEEFSEWTSIPKGTLRDWRQNLKGPPFVKMGRRVFYNQKQCEKYFEKMTIYPDDLNELVG